MSEFSNEEAANRKYDWRKSKSFTFALGVLSQDENDTNNNDTSKTASQLISKFTNMINEHAKTAHAFNKEMSNDKENKKIHEIAALIAERKKDGNSRRPSAVDSNKNELQDVKLKHVEVTDKPKTQQETALPQVKLQHIVDNKGNIEYEEFLTDHSSFKINDINSELRPSSFKFLRSISDRETIEFMTKYENDWQERLQQILEEDGDLIPVDDDEYDDYSSKKT